MTERIVKLTEHYRACLLSDGHDGALRIIDEQSADLATLVEQLGAEQRMRQAAEAQADLFAERAKNLEVQWRGANSALAQAESKYPESPRAAAERAVLDACADAILGYTSDVRVLGSYAARIVEAAIARRAVSK